MDATEERNQVVVHANYEAFVFLLILFSIANSLLLLLLQNEEARSVVRIMEGAISVFLLADFTQRLIHAHHRTRFLFRYHGWLTLIGSLPLPGVRLLRLIQPLSLARAIHQQELQEMGSVVVRKRAQTTLLFVVLFTVMMIETASILILSVEQQLPTANIRTGFDAIWWSIVTVATVGYGDFYPTTERGRIIGLLVIFSGVGLFAVLTGFLADWFRRPRQFGRRLRMKTNDKYEAVSEMRRLLDMEQQAHQQRISELQEQLDEIEAALRRG